MYYSTYYSQVHLQCLISNLKYNQFQCHLILIRLDLSLIVSSDTTNRIHKASSCNWWTILSYYFTRIPLLQSNKSALCCIKKDQILKSVVSCGLIKVLNYFSVGCSETIVPFHSFTLWKLCRFPTFYRMSWPLYCRRTFSSSSNRMLSVSCSNCFQLGRNRWFYYAADKLQSAGNRRNKMAMMLTRF